MSNNNQDTSVVQQTSLFEQPRPADMPRPLQPGEFFCHRCKKYVPMTEHTKHHEQERRLVQGRRT